MYFSSLGELIKLRFGLDVMKGKFESYFSKIVTWGVPPASGGLLPPSASATICVWVGNAWERRWTNLGPHRYQVIIF